MTADPSEKSAELPPIDVTLEPVTFVAGYWTPEISPVPVKTRAELLAEIETWRRIAFELRERMGCECFGTDAVWCVGCKAALDAHDKRQRDTISPWSALLSAAESVQRHCPIEDPPSGRELDPEFRYMISISGAQILALRSAIANA